MWLIIGVYVSTTIEKNRALQLTKRVYSNRILDRRGKGGETPWAEE